MSNQTPDRGFNTVSDSSVPRRQVRSNRQKWLILAIFAVVVLMLAALLALAIGAIVHAAVGNGAGDGKVPPAMNQGDIGWNTIQTSANASKYGALVLINEDHAYTFPQEADEHLVSMVSYRSQNKSSSYYKITTIANIQFDEEDLLAEEAMIAADAMLVAMSKATGENGVTIHWGYRSAEAQESLHDANPTLTSESGYSDHHSGYGFSLHLTQADGTRVILSSKSEAYKWLADHAAKYGFVIRYPADKTEVTGEDDYAEYFRYVGVPHATLMAEKNYCLEEYVDFLVDNAKDGLNVKGANGHEYVVYYYTNNGVTEVQVPTNCAYSISGTNAGGIVVTVDRSTEVESDTDSDTESETATDTETETETNA